MPQAKLCVAERVMDPWARVRIGRGLTEQFRGAVEIACLIVAPSLRRKAPGGISAPFARGELADPVIGVGTPGDRGGSLALGRTWRGDPCGVSRRRGGRRRCQLLVRCNARFGLRR